MSEARKGKKLSPEHEAKFREGARKYWAGRPLTEERKALISRALTGLRQSAETRAKKSKAHMGKIPWNKGLTRVTSPSLARIGDATRRRWTPEKRRILSERNTKFWNAWWAEHPEARATNAQVSRPTSIELMARNSIARRGIPMVVSKRLEDICYPDVILPTLKIAVFCHGCFWHACPVHCPVVPNWLRAKIKDKFVEAELEKRGWTVLVAWEHEFKANKDIVGAKLDAMMQSPSEVSE